MTDKVLGGSPAVIFYYHRFNRYSFNALAGALDRHPGLADLPITLARTAGELKTAAADLLRRHPSIIIAFSLMTPQVPETCLMLRQLQSDHDGRITTMAGGPHATADPRGTSRAGIDIVFRGEAERSFPQVLQKAIQGQAWRDIAGITFREEDEMVSNPAPLPVDIDGFASFSPKRYMLGPIEITRGCPFACSFCQTSHIFGVQPRHRSVANIVRQAAVLRSRNRKVVRLLSPNAFSYGSPDGRQLNLAAMSELLAALRETVSRNGRIIFGYFPSEVRPEHVTPETLELLRQFADNDELVIGAQSGSEHVLEACHRSHTVESVLTAVSLARKFGYKVIVDFIYGLPHESAQDVRETVSVMEELARLGARVHPHAFMPLPQTAFSAEVPAKVSPDIVRALEQLKQRRAIYGDWPA